VTALPHHYHPLPPPHHPPHPCTTHHTSNAAHCCPTSFMITAGGTTTHSADGGGADAPPPPQHGARQTEGTRQRRAYAAVSSLLPHLQRCARIVYAPRSDGLGISISRPLCPSDGRCSGRTNASSGNLSPFSTPCGRSNTAGDRRARSDMVPAAQAGNSILSTLAPQRHKRAGITTVTDGLS